MQISEHFTLDEAIRSQIAHRYGIDNVPHAAVLENMKAAALHMEQVRDFLGHPIHVDSWYRSEALNKAAGGSLTSAHMRGWAIDFVCYAFGSPLDICRAIEASGLQFDRLIFEGSWVHISFDPAMQRRVFTAHFEHGSVHYTEGLPA
jgi:putative chitinase